MIIHLLIGILIVFLYRKYFIKSNHKFWDKQPVSRNQIKKEGIVGINPKFNIVLDKGYNFSEIVINNTPKCQELFQFINNHFSGLIDFYFACNDFLAYDIALTINAWCFDNKNNFMKQRFKSFIKGYENHRVLTEEEKNSLSILLRGAAMRILLTRLHDQLFHPEGAFVEPKDPGEYAKILQFHQNTNIKNYLL